MNFLLGLFPGKWWLYAIAAGLIFSAGAGIAWRIQSGLAHEKELAEMQARESDAIQQRKFSDKASGTHAATLATTNNKLGNAREKIATLSGRQCLDADTVSVLNAIGGESVPAAAGQLAGTAATPATGTGLRWATDGDAGTAIATCRAGYAEVASQLNQILDIEDRRHPPN